MRLWFGKTDPLFVVKNNRKDPAGYLQIIVFIYSEYVAIENDSLYFDQGALVEYFQCSGKFKTFSYNSQAFE